MWLTHCKLGYKFGLQGRERFYRSGGRRVNQLSAAPLKEVGKTLQYMYPSVVNKVTWETYESMCSSGSVVPCPMWDYSSWAAT